MNAYICVTYAQDDREVSDGFCRALSRYGFRYQCIHELSDPVKRGGVLTEAALVVALTSPAADRAETVAADIRRALERGMKVLCVSSAESRLDGRFCAGSGGAVRIPYPVGETPDRHSVALFIHRLFVRHLSLHTECFVESRCAEDLYGGIIRMACHARGGDEKACYALGRAYEQGEGVPALENEAALWMAAAAERNMPDALIRMGILRQTGKGTERDPHAAFVLFERARVLGDPRGEYRVGLCYLEGMGVIMDPDQGILCLEAAAKAGYAPALYRLGCLYRDGIGARRNLFYARDLFYAACLTDMPALRGEDGCERPLLSLYGRRARYTAVSLRHLRQTSLRRLLGDVAIAPPRREGADPLASTDRCLGTVIHAVSELPEDRWDTPIGEMTVRSDGSSSADGLNDPVGADAAFALGELLATGDPGVGFRPALTAALRWYRYAARLGHTEALFALGDAYRRGIGVPSAEMRAAELFRLAADRGSVRGQFAFGVCCERGYGVREDPFLAVSYYERAAEAGYAPAQHNLGGCYEQGRGVIRHDLMAVEWYAKAAEGGLAEAMCRLALCYEHGSGVSADPEKALRLYEDAAARGHSYAQYRLGLFYHRRAAKRDEQDQDKENMAVGDAARVSGGRDTVDEAVLDRDVSGEEEALYGVSDRLQALSFYRQASEKGSADADYALFICYRLGLGVARDEEGELECLRRGAAGGCLQAIYELGLCHMEGRGMPRDQRAAVACFTRAYEVWRIRSEDPLWIDRRQERDALPPGGMPAHLAAGGALYMLGYCALYGIGRTERNVLPDPTDRPTPERVEEALSYLRPAADLCHGGALTLLGDLCLYGLTAPVTAISAEDEALEAYLEAAREEHAENKRHIATADQTDNPIDAFLSLAYLALRRAESEEDEGDAAPMRAHAWRTLASCASLGSADALVGMAECLYRGWGTDPQRGDAGARLLARATEVDGGRVSAFLWLGDRARSQWGGEPDAQRADELYLRGLECSCAESECGPYTLGLRRADRLKKDQNVRTEVLYRLATLRAFSFAEEPDRRESFSYLAAAILRGHTAALDDLARMYEYETTHPRVSPDGETERRGLLTRLWKGKRQRFRRKLRGAETEMTRSDRVARMHHTWMNDYYTALWPEPLPFSFAMRSLAVERDIPAYVTDPVTPLMRVNALCYLGECFFEGRGIPSDPQAACACYRAAVDVPLRLERGQPMPPALVNATYSLGWCKLYGVGTPVDARAAVGHLNRVAKVHSGAAYTLGICHEEGRGVVIPDPREALKHYRKAQTMGHPKAAERVLYLEKLLKDRGET